MHHLHGHQQRRGHHQPLLTAHRHQIPHQHRSQPGAPVPVAALPPARPAVLASSCTGNVSIWTAA